MKSSEKYDLWQVETLRELDENHALVKNLINGSVMMRCRLPAESYPLMKKLSSLRHQNLMAVYDCEIIDGCCICLCEYIAGETIEQRIIRCGTFSEQQASEILSQICDALTALHSEGIIHRDVTASNVMLSDTMTVKLIDYDIARAVRENASRDTQILGTAGYAAPEQFGFSQTGVRSDIYACGALLNVMLTGALPGEKRYPGSLSEVIAYCIEIDENKRYSSAAELKLALTKKHHRSPDELHGRFRPLPGFRSKNPVLKLLTSLCFAVYGLLTIEFVRRLITNISRLNSDSTDLSALKGIRSDCLLALVFLILLTLIPYLTFGDVGRLSRRISPSDYLRGERIMKLIGWLSIIAGILVMLFVRP